MAKAKRSRKIKRVIRTKKVSRAAYKSTNNKKLSIELIILALLIFVLAAMVMSKGSGNQVINPTQVKVTASPTAKPVVNTVKPVTTVKTTK